MECSPRCQGNRVELEASTATIQPASSSAVRASTALDDHHDTRAHPCPDSTQISTERERERESTLRPWPRRHPRRRAAKGRGKGERPSLLSWPSFLIAREHRPHSKPLNGLLSPAQIILLNIIWKSNPIKPNSYQEKAAKSVAI